MSSTEALRKPTKDNYHMVALRYGPPSAYVWVRYTDWSTDVTCSFPRLGGVYTSLPSMGVTIPKNSGSIKDERARISMPLNALTERLSTGEPHSQVKCYIMEFSKNADSDGVTLLHFIGFLMQSVSNDNGKPNRVRLEFGSWKQFIAQKMGMPILSHCTNTFGDAKCGIDVEAIKETGTLSIIEGKKVTITGLSAHVDRYWHAGYVEVAGLRIRIRDWLSGVSFELGKAPPEDWLGASVSVAPGCAKDVTTCRDLWNNEEHFNGAAYKIAARNPVFEK